MTLEPKKSLDNVSWQILTALQKDARLSFAELGRRVGLSLPAVAERVRRMEEAGIITGYSANIAVNKIGLNVMAYSRVSTNSNQYPAIIALAGTLPEVVECHHLTGPDSFIMKVVVSSIPHLEEVITKLSAYGQTATSVVLSSPVTGKVFDKNSISTEI